MHKCLGATEWFYVCVQVFYRLLEQQLSSAPSLQRQAPSPGMQDPAGSNTGTHSTAGRLETEHTHFTDTEHINSNAYQQKTTVTKVQVYKEKVKHTHKTKDVWRDTAKHMQRNTHTNMNVQRQKHTTKYTHTHAQTKNRRTNTHTHHRSPTGICSHTHQLTHPPTFMCNLASSSSP